MAARKIRRGIAAVVFRRSGRGVEFLVLRRVLRWRGWETMKGGGEAGESPRRTLARELREELGLNTRLARVRGILGSERISFRIPVRFRPQMGGNTHALYKPFFLVELPAGARVSLAANIPREHSGYKWAPLEKAFSLLTYGNTRSAFRAAARAIRLRPS